jgi:hypothetical protein
VKRVLAAWAVVVVVASIGTGVMIWRLYQGPGQPEISAFSGGHLTRVGPSLNCEVLDPSKCDPSSEEGELPVTDRHPVQLSVPEAVARAPWYLVLVYDDIADATSTRHPPNSQLAVTIPTVDPQRGRLRQIVVQLKTVVQNQAGDLIGVPHKEWSVQMAWPQPAP